MKKILPLIMLSLVLILGACSGGSTEKESSSKDTMKDDHLVLAVLSDADSLDPHIATDVPSAVVLTNIVENLVTTDEKGEIVPALAKSWETIDDTTWEFKLQEGVQFHDGEDFNAEAVKKNIERILDPEVAAPRAFIFEIIEEVIVVDEHTVQIKTEYPFAPLVAHFNHPVGAMISPALIDKDYEAMKEGKTPGSVIAAGPIGTGRFIFESWDPGNEIQLTNNEEYWGEPAKVAGATFKVIPESGTRLAELETGHAHIIEPLQPNEVKLIENGDFGTVDITEEDSLAYIGFNTEKEPFNDPKVRQAVTMLINTEEIVDGIYDGFGRPAVGPLAPKVFGYNDQMKPLPYNVEKAKELLKEAGYEDGFKTTVWTNDSPQRTETAVYLQQALKEANIDVAIESMEWGAYLEKTSQGEHDMFILGLSNPVGDADYFLTQLFHSKNKGASGNRTFYENEEVDRLLDEARQEIDEEKRLALYTEVQEILIEDAPMVYVLHQAALTGLSNKIDGFWMNGSAHYKIENVEFVE